MGEGVVEELLSLNAFRGCFPNPVSLGKGTSKCQLSRLASWKSEFILL
jgi:hypothetical protein